MSLNSANIKLSAINGHLICGLCGGYLIDATVLTECVHVFCRSCILKYLTENKVCPLCQSLIQETRPGQSLLTDVTLQRVVFKLVPGLLRTEMKRLAEFKSTVLSSDLEGQVTAPPGDVSDFGRSPLPTALATRSLSKSPSALLQFSQLTGSRHSIINRIPDSLAFLVDESDYLSISLERVLCSPDRKKNLPSFLRTTRNTTGLDFQNETNSVLPSVARLGSFEAIHLLCPSVVTIQTLHNLLLAKYQLEPHQLVIDFYLGGQCLEASHSLREIVFLYSFPVTCQRMRLDFVFVDANMAWWGRPMPRLERSHNGWIESPLVCSTSSPESTSCTNPHQRSRSASGDGCPSESRYKSKRTSF